MTQSKAAVLLLPLALAACAHRNEFDETGGVQISRSSCPAVAIPTYTGDVSLFAPEQSHDLRALDVTAQIVNLRSTCDESDPAKLTARASFDVVATRANPRGSRDVVLPYFATVMRAGTTLMSKQVSRVSVHFDDGQLRGKGSGAATASVARALATLPQSVMDKVQRKRKPTDADAAVDPMSDPKIRNAVRQASFELLIGFQLSEPQLAYNATR